MAAARCAAGEAAGPVATAKTSTAPSDRPASADRAQVGGNPFGVRDAGVTGARDDDRVVANEGDAAVAGGRVEGQHPQRALRAQQPDYTRRRDGRRPPAGSPSSIPVPAPDSAPLPTLGATTTPAMRQPEAKRQYPLALMLFRMGDFYELFYEDALVAARALDPRSPRARRTRPAPRCRCAACRFTPPTATSRGS
jgi:hypothetical protein